MYHPIFEAEFNVPRVGPKSIQTKTPDPATGASTVKREDLAGFIYANTDGGREVFTVWTIRTNDSKKDPTKKAGDEMVVNGRLGACMSDIRGGGSPLGNLRDRYAKYNLITMCVNRLDGVDYTNKRLSGEARTRHLKVDKVFKLVIGNNTYHVQ